MRPAVLLCSVVALAILLLPPASAHYDLLVYDGAESLTAGDQVTYSSELHYHRLAGHITGSEGSSLELWATVEGRAPERIAGPATKLVLNHWFTCCDNKTWTPTDFTIRNVGTTPTEVDVRMALLHDGFGVSMYNAESGAVSISAVTFTAIAGGFAVAARRTPPPAPTGNGVTAARRGLIVLGATWALIALFSLVGMLRYGTGPGAGTLAATADLPVIEFELTMHLMFILVNFILWIVALTFWMKAHRSPGAPGRLLRGLDVALLAGPVIITVSLMLEYGRFWEGFWQGIFPLGLLAWGAFWPRSAPARAT